MAGIARLHIVFLQIAGGNPVGIGQQAFGCGQQIYNAGHSHRHTYQCQLKHAYAVITGIYHHAMHHQVGRSTDKGTQSAQYRDIRQRYEKLAGRQVHRLGPTFYYRGEYDHDRSIVEKSGNKGYGRQHAELSLSHCGLALRQNLLYDLCQRTRLTHALADQKQQSHGYHALVAESFEHLFGRDYPEAEEQYHYREKHHAGTHYVFDQNGQHPHKRQYYYYYIQRHDDIN